MKRFIIFILTITAMILAVVPIEIKNNEVVTATPDKHFWVFSKNMDSTQVANIGEMFVEMGILDSNAYVDSLAAFLARGQVSFSNDLYVGSEVLAEKSYVDSLSMIRIQLPDTLAAVVGDTLQVFYRGIVEAVNPYDYHIIITGSKGRQYNRYYEYAPVGADTASTYQTIFSVYDSAMNPVAADTTIIKVQAAWQPTVTTILPIGDSLTANEYWNNEFYRRLTGTGGTPVGNAFTGLVTIGNLGTAPNQRIGYSGMSWGFYIRKTAESLSLQYQFFSTHDKDATDYTSIWSDGTNQWTLNAAVSGKIKLTKLSHTTDPPASGTLTHVSGATHTSDIVYTTIESIDGNPLWDYNDDKLDFTAYCTRNGFSNIDVVIPLLGWNSLTPYQRDAEDHAALIAYAVEFLDSLHSQFPTAQVLLTSPSMPPVYNGMASYGLASGYSNYYGILQSMIGLNKAYENLSKEAAYKDWVYYTNAASQFDSEYGFSISTKKPNNRYIGTTRELVSTGRVHPNQYGYYLISDAIYRQFVRLFCK